ncbi:MAG: sigma-70 family RNA polymerase sigma factor, partial [Chloroflexota bacterium]
RIFGYVCSRVRTQQAAEDITATVFEKALRSQHSYDPKRGDFDAWLFQIARNAIIDHHKAQTRRPVQTDLKSAVHLATADPPLEQVMVKHEQHLALNQALEQLSERDKEIIQLRFFGRLTNRKIAVLLAMKEKTVSVIIYRALKKMKMEFEARETE